LKKAYLLLSLLLVTNLFFIQSASTKQLFDIISGNDKEKAEIPPKMEESKQNSIFDSVDEDKDPEPINFNQVNEKLSSTKSEKSLNTVSLFGDNESESEKKDKPEKKISENLEKVNQNQQLKQNVKKNEEKVSVSYSNSSNTPIVPGMGHVTKSVEHSALNTPQPKKEASHHEEVRHANHREEPNVKNEAHVHSLSNNVKTLEEPNPNKDLQKHVTALIEMNSRLLKKINSHNKIHKKFNQNHQRMISFIQNYESDIKDLKNNYQNNHSVIEKTLLMKDEEIKKLYKQTEHHYGDLQNKFEKVNNQMNQIKNQEQKIFKEIAVEPNFANVVVDDSLFVQGEANLNKVNTKQVDLGQIKIGPNKIAITDANTQITFGQESLSIAELFENMKAVRAVLDLCGNNFENCIKKEEQLHEKQFEQQREILESLKSLKIQTAEIINNHRKKLR